MYRTLFLNNCQRNGLLELPEHDIHAMKEVLGFKKTLKLLFKVFRLQQEVQDSIHQEAVENTSNLNRKRKHFCHCEFCRPRFEIPSVWKKSPRPHPNTPETTKNKIKYFYCENSCFETFAILNYFSSLKIYFYCLNHRKTYTGLFNSYVKWR